MKATALKLKKLSTAIKRLRVLLNNFKKSSARLDVDFKHTGAWSDAYVKKFNIHQNAIEIEIQNLLHSSGSFLEHLVNLQMKNPGDDTYIYFRLLKSQQMELLSTIKDEIEIIRIKITQCVMIRRMLKEHLPTLQKTNTLIEIVQQRLETMPSTILPINIQYSSFNIQNSKFSYQIHYNFMQTCCSEIEISKSKADTALEELRLGWKLFLRLSTKGVSPPLQQMIKKLSGKHNRRRSKFLQAIKSFRSSQQ